MPTIDQIRRMDALKTPSCFSYGDNFTLGPDFGIRFVDTTPDRVTVEVYYRGHQLVSKTPNGNMRVLTTEHGGVHSQRN